MAGPDPEPIKQDQRISDQRILNSSFDTEFEISISEIAGYNLDTDTLKRIACDEQGRLKIVIDGGFPSSIEISNDVGNPIPITGSVTASPATPLSQSTVAVGAGVSSTVSLTTQVTKAFSIQVKSNTAVATSWNVVLEVSNDNTNFDTILTHRTVSGDGTIVFSGGNSYPCLYMRVRVVALTLGPATSLTITIVGTP